MAAAAISAAHRARGLGDPAAASSRRAWPLRRGLEDGAIVSLAFCAGLCRSEIAALCWQDITDTRWRGQLRVRVRASKTNPEAAREDHRLLVGSFAAAVSALRAATVPDGADRVVPLSGVQINRPRRGGRRAPRGRRRW